MKYEKFKLVVDYETANNVEDYMVNGWHVWPLLRMIICFPLLPSVSPNKIIGLGSLLRNNVELVLKRISYIKAVFNLKAFTNNMDLASLLDKVDILFLTVSGRRVAFNELLYDIYSDPFRDILHDMGYSTLIFEENNGLNLVYSDSIKYPEYSDSIKFLLWLHVEAHKIRLSQDKIVEPYWFADYKKLVFKVIGREVNWYEISIHIESVTTHSIVFEQWLRKINPKYFFVVCWYSPLVMAAIMAGRRCNIKVIEIQHGIQGEGHFAYSSWFKRPFDGYEVIPDIFWCWGKIAAEELKKYNPAFSDKIDIVSGGNLWLNKFRQLEKGSLIHKPIESKHKVLKKILVTLQEDIPKILIEAIASSPTTYLWMFRFHPARIMDDRRKDMEKIKKIGYPGIEFKKANKLLLYELFSECDVHVTEGSTSALEALAFGTPSIILSSIDGGKTSKIYFNYYINNNIMYFADTVSELFNAINMAMPIDKTNRIVTDLFADDKSGKSLISNLLLNAEDGSIS